MVRHGGYDTQPCPRIVVLLPPDIDSRLVAVGGETGASDAHTTRGFGTVTRTGSRRAASALRGQSCITTTIIDCV